jgi:hypothetical protein
MVSGVNKEKRCVVIYLFAANTSVMVEVPVEIIMRPEDEEEEEDELCPTQ